MCEHDDTDGIQTREKKSCLKNHINLHKKIWFRITIALIVALFFELCLCNISAISTANLTPTEIDIEKGIIDGNSFVIEGLDISGVETINLGFSGSCGITHVSVEVKDDSSANEFVFCNSTQISAGSDKYNDDTIKLKGNGGLHALRITWEKVDALNTIYDLSSLITYEVIPNRIVINYPIPYKVYFPRLALFIMINCAISLYTQLRIKDVHCVFTCFNHKVVYSCFTIPCILMAVFVFFQLQPNDMERFIYTQEIEYPFPKDIYDYRLVTHSIIFDSLYHGVPYVRTENDDGILLEADNPYDPSSRNTDRYWFDYAQYGGKVYFYFGITPTLVFYAPYYLITHKLPSYLASGLFFSILTIISGFLCFWEAARRYMKRVNLLFLCIIATAVVLGANVLMLQSCSDRYYLSIASMQAFLYLSVWSGIKALNTSNVRSKRALLIICAFFCFLMVWSRPVGVFSVIAWLVPLFVYELSNKSIRLKDKIADVLAFGIPICLFAGIALYWNYIRFGSGLDFGIKWQLTIEDCRNKSVSLLNCMEAIFHYFFEGVNISGAFPWIRGTEIIDNHSGAYLYSRIANGVFTIPITWGVLLICKAQKKERKDRELLTISFATIIMSLTISIVDFSLCGITERYVCDILPMMCVVSGLILISYCSSEKIDSNVLVPRISLLLCITTYIVAICSVYYNYRNFIALYSPDNYLDVVKMLSII